MQGKNCISFSLLPHTKDVSKLDVLHPVNIEGVHQLEEEGAFHVKSYITKCWTKLMLIYRGGEPNNFGCLCWVRGETSRRSHCIADY